MLETAIILLILLIISSVASTLHVVPGEHLRWQMEFMNWSFLGIQAPVVVMLAFAVMFCMYRSNWLASARLNSSVRKDIYH
ncbi:hypothetical protein EIO60_03593|nr:hypothetical protein [Candidatus Pantoea persica]